VLLIGSPHSGLDSLGYQLSRHPHLSFGTVQDHRYLAGRTPHSATTASEYAESFKGSHWFGTALSCSVRRTFDTNPEAMYLGNAGATGNFFQKPGVEAVQAVLRLLGSDLRIVVMLRDPVDLINAMHGPGQVLNQSMLEGTCYADSLSSWLEAFPRRNFLFLQGEEYFQDNRATLSRVFSFLCVDEKLYDWRKLTSGGHWRARRPVRIETRQRFHRRKGNRECRRRLEQQTQLEFFWEGIFLESPVVPKNNF